MFKLESMRLRNHADTQPVKRLSTGRGNAICTLF